MARAGQVPAMSRFENNHVHGDVSRLAACHITPMATYTVSPQADRIGFDVAVIADGGAVQTTLGFTNEAAANAWVTQAMRLNKSWTPGRAFGRLREP
jgi:hypothetical protein